MPQILDFDEKLLSPQKVDGRREDGVFSFIARGDEIEAELKRLYGRDGLCLKVFKEKREGVLLCDYTWGDKGVTLFESGRVQNLFARHCLAPRVYDLVFVNDHAAQVTDYVRDDGRKFDRNCAIDIVQEYGIRSVTGDVNEFNWVGSKMVDWQYHLFPPEYRDRLLERINEGASWGSRPEPYQTAFNTRGQRDMGPRVQAMRLHTLDFHGRSVLDIGCNIGAFCRDALSRGAKIAVGVDLPHVAELAFEYNNYLGHWNIDFIGARLPAERDKIKGAYDIVYVLSAKQTQPFPWIFDHCDDMLFVEGHVPEKEWDYRPMLEEVFRVVECLGSTRDHGPRPLFRCYR